MSISSMADSSAASSAALAGSRPAMRIWRIGRTRHIARACDRAWTPVPRMASTLASSRASRRADKAEQAPVRTAVIAVPSSKATGGAGVRIERRDQRLVRGQPGAGVARKQRHQLGHQNPGGGHEARHRGQEPLLFGHQCGDPVRH